MHIGSVDLTSEVLIIAEIGNNHEGDVELAEELVHLAADSGAQAVKFQTINPYELVSPEDEGRIAQLNRYALTPEDHLRLKDAADRAGIMFMSTPFSLSAVEMLDPLVEAFKIASGDNNFIPLLKTVARTQKPIIMSTGMASMAQIEYSRSVVKKEWDRLNVNPCLILLHCVSSYPTPVEEANLSAIKLLSEMNDFVGYSDHTLGTTAAPLAVTLGARVIEKHFTISKSHSDFRDHQLSAEPDELKEMIERIKEAELYIGDGKTDIQECEIASAQVAKRSICANKPLEEGHVLSMADLCWLRPALGVEPGQESELLGRMLKKDIMAGYVFDLEDVE